LYVGVQGNLVGLIDGLEDFVGMLVGLEEGDDVDFVGMLVGLREGAKDGDTVTRLPL